MRRTFQETAALSLPQLSAAGRLFVAAAILEGITWAGLLLGMALKYGPLANTALVKVFGPLHGAAFLFYVGVTLTVWLRQRWPLWAVLLALLSAVPPLVTVPLEWWFRRRGLLSPLPATATRH